MKKLLRHLLLSLGLFSSPFLFSHSFLFAAFPITISLVPPTESLVLDNLDVRDSLNRPVHTVAAKKSFEQLWSCNLTKNFLFALTPTKVRMFELLQTNWEHAKHFWCRVWINTWQKLIAVVPVGFTLLRPILRLDNFKFQVMLLVGTNQSDGFVHYLLDLIMSSTRILR